jgi:alpha-glucosidase (family GH31 glycosyl hydrolase)
MTRNAYDSGMPLCRGLYINYPQADKAYRYDEYLFGDKFLVAPIMDASHKQLNGITERSLWLPDGDWYDYFTNKPYRGNEDISVEKTLNEFPLFVKGGSIIPMAPYQDYSGAPLDTLLLYAYTPAKSQKSTFNLYEDDGETFLFEKHQFRWIKLSYEYTDHSGQKIVIGKPSGNFAGSVEKRAYKIYIVNTDKPQRLYVNGKTLANWSWDASQRVLTMNVDQQDVNSDVTIEAQL